MYREYNMQEIFNKVDSHYDEFKQFWIDICNIESFSTDKAGVNDVAKHVEKFSIEKGFQIKERTFEKAGKCLSIYSDEQSKLPGIALLAHMDTVHEKGKFGNPPVKVDNEYIYGPGVCDCKGGIAVALLTMQVLKEIGYNKRPLKLILTGDEEVSNSLSDKGSIDFICDEVRGHAAAINCEGGEEGKVTVGRKGIIKLKVDVKGKASHAGSAYSEGVSAIKEAAHKIIDIEKASNQEKITYNCGVIQGGEVANTIPHHCSFILDIRYINQEDLEKAMDHIETIVAHSYIPGTSATITELGRRLPMELKEENVKLFEQISKVSGKYNLEPVEKLFKGGGSDSAYTVLAGVPSVDSLGTIGDGVHTINERSTLNSLTSRAKLIVASILKLPDDFHIKDSIS
ncbi:MAG: M20 family metallopeptidase [Clostridiales bacterium]|nr:M20 family metallopeptidase [Clostridiales bacterium]